MRKVLLVAFLMVFTLMAGVSQVEAQNGFFEIRGSDTQVNLSGNLAEAFMDINPEAVISVTGGGSGTGIAGIINNQFALANSSRQISDEEMEQARERGVEPVRIVIALDGLSVIVHEDNPLSDLTVDEIGVIFRGEITNWSELGGEDKEISMYGRQRNSGIMSFLENMY